MEEKSTTRSAAETHAETQPEAATKPVLGRHDDAYKRDQADQRRAATRFDSSRFRRKQEAGTAPKYTR